MHACFYKLNPSIYSYVGLTLLLTIWYDLKTNEYYFVICVLTFRNRNKNKQKAKELLREGRLKEAREYFQRCVEVTSEMAYDVIKACRLKNIDVIGVYGFVLLR